ncbi:MAG TPA: hypothetical protein VFC86_13350, partial [Planctomycetota bacterium]|nr:hypothetical protein [Planctomycetota bacterium]
MKWLPLLGLLLIQDPDVDALLKQLEDESIEVREKAATKLIELGDKAEEKVKARLASADGELKHLCKRILEQLAVPKKLRGLLPPLRKVTIDAKDRSLKEVLEDLRTQGALTLETGEVGDAAVSVSIKEATPLEALDAVCKAAGYGYFIDGRTQYTKGKFLAAGGAAPAIVESGVESKIRLQPGSYLAVPRQFIRHYLVEPTNISLSKSDNFRQSYNAANLNLRVAWAPGANPQTGEIAVESATDDKGRVLFEAPKNAPKYSGGGTYISGGLNASVQLAYPEADARKIASIKGKATIKYLLEEKILSFEPVEAAEPQKKEHDGIKVEMTGYKIDGNSVTVSFTFTGRSAEPGAPPGSLHSMPIRLKTEDGSAGYSGGRSSRRGGDGEVTTCEMTFRNVTSKVKAVEIVAETIYHSDSFDF